VGHFFRQSPILVDLYEAYLDDQDLTAFLRQVSETYGIGTLERILANGETMARRGAVLAIGRLADYRSNAVVGRALSDLDRGVRVLAELAIVKLWTRVGASGHQRRLAAVEEDLEASTFDRASQAASKLIQDAPWIAQAWYQRGKAYFHLNQFAAAVRDCHQALEINAYHFPAAAVMGRACEMQRDVAGALESYRRALRVNPNMEEIRARVVHLQRGLKNQ
jgi:tetratricopeptide (TPR) repeat protein